MWPEQRMLRHTLTVHRRTRPGRRPQKKRASDCCAPRPDNSRPVARRGSGAVGSSDLQPPQLHAAVPGSNTHLRRWRGSDGCHYTLYTLEACPSKRSPSLGDPILGAMAIATSYNLSRYSPSFGSSTFRPLRSRMPRTSSCTLLPRCQQSPGRSSQWSKADCGNAWPLVALRRAATKPKDSETGKWAFNCTKGVPSHWVSSTTHPRRKLRQP